MPVKTTTFKITADIDSKSFPKKLKNALKSESHFHSAMTSALSDEVSLHLQTLKDAGRILSFRIHPYPYPQKGINSLKEAATEKGGYVFWYFKISIATSKSVQLSEKNIIAPKTLKWEPISYGYGVQKYFKFKLVKQKTQNLHHIEFLKLILPTSLLKTAHRLASKKCECLAADLRPVISGAWDWHLHFICSGCGEKYLCQCFKKAFDKQTKLDEKWKSEQPKDHIKIYEKHGWPTVMNREWAENAAYRKGICHLCTNTPSTLSYCSTMYGSDIKVKYGPYIMRTSVEKGISEREAENEVRELIGVPKIGEGWIGETELYRTVCYIVGSKHEVVREASPKWLGRQRLDIFVPSLNLAIEYHGQQHFRPVEYFGGDAAFEKVVERDILKERLCKENGIILLVFKYSDALTEEVVRKRILSRLKRETF